MEIIAHQLLKYCSYVEDTEGHRMNLRFIRDTDKREIDFVVSKDGKPQFAVECKLSLTKASSRFDYFSPTFAIRPRKQFFLGMKKVYCPVFWG